YQRWTIRSALPGGSAGRSAGSFDGVGADSWVDENFQTPSARLVIAHHRITYPILSFVYRVCRPRAMAAVANTSGDGLAPHRRARVGRGCEVRRGWHTPLGEGRRLPHATGR